MDTAVIEIILLFLFTAQKFYTHYVGLFEDGTESDAVLEILPHMYNKDDVLSSHRISEFW